MPSKSISLHSIGRLSIYKTQCLMFFVSILLISCGGSGSNNTGIPQADTSTVITNAIFIRTSASCTDYIERYTATSQDIQNSVFFDANITVSNNGSSCILSSNNIPNHDFNDGAANFATNVATKNRSFTIPQHPTAAPTATPLAQNVWDAVLLNGVVLDLLSAGCYQPNSPMADPNGNVMIGCNVTDGWLLDPLSPLNNFGTDSHNAHTQPDGSYHYHGNPMAMFDDSPTATGSPVIGFAADGFPIYGSYFLDPSTSTVRKAISGYMLRSGTRPGPDVNNPGGSYDGRYIDDYEYTGTGDLDECNGMTVNGIYGYYVTDDYPWVLNCFTGTVNASFSK